MNGRRIPGGLAAALLCLALAACDGGAKPAAFSTHTNSLGMEFALLPAGAFEMGSPEGEREALCADIEDKGRNVVCRQRVDSERPRHTVKITRPFYLGKHEVTLAQWEAVMSDRPFGFEESAGDMPLMATPWEDAQEFIRRLNELEGHNRYRLPTEAEWEYAARAGTTTRYFFGDDAGELRRYAWFDKGDERGPQPVGQREPNPWGLFDMYGNAPEWVQDRYWGEYYRESPRRDPRGPDAGVRRVVRGGHFASPAADCRSASRAAESPERDFSRIGRTLTGGFRLAMDVE